MICVLKEKKHCDYLVQVGKIFLNLDSHRLIGKVIMALQKVEPSMFFVN